MFVSKTLTLSEATEIVNARTGAKGRGPIWEALKEGAVRAELWQGNWHSLTEHKWRSLSPEWWVDPMINWPMSPHGSFPNQPNGNDIKIDRCVIDELWPEAASQNEIAATDRTGAPGAPSSAHLVEHEFKRRAAVGETDSNLTRQAIALKGWLEKAHPALAPMTAGTIENRIRALWHMHAKTDPRK